MRHFVHAPRRKRTNPHFSLRARGSAWGLIQCPDLPASSSKRVTGFALTENCKLRKLTGMEALGSYMRRRRDELDLSLREFAKRLDCSAAFISDIELGRRNPSEKVLAEIARVLGAKIEDLQAMDVRAPIDEIKRLTQNDPRFALAFRTMIDKKVSAEELLDLANQKKAHRSPGGSKK